MEFIQEREAEREVPQEQQPWFQMREQLRRTRELPRVIKGRDFYRAHGGKVRAITHRVDWPAFPDEGVPLKSFLAWLIEIDPLQDDEQLRGHGHQNEAVFYILEGRGYELHDGVKYPWEAGDVVIVHAGCVHAHFSADPARPARALVINPKPMYMHLNLKEQQSRS